MGNIIIINKQAYNHLNQYYLNSFYEKPMKIFIILITCIFTHASASNVYEEQKRLAVTSATNGACAGVSLTPVFWCFMQKSRFQLGIPGYVNYYDSFKTGFRAIPNTAATISIQLYIEELSKRFLQKVGVDNTYLTGLGCFFGGLFSAPMYDVMNRQSMGTSTIQAFKAFCKHPLSTAPIVVREFCFLGGIQASNPVANWMQATFGENEYVKNSSCFATCFLASLVGHPFDTILTIMQAKKHWDAKILMKGSGTKAVGVGLFGMIYSNLRAQKEKFLGLYQITKLEQP